MSHGMTRADDLRAARLAIGLRAPEAGKEEVWSAEYGSGAGRVEQGFGDLGKGSRGGPNSAGEKGEKGRRAD
jgi:hypothetical protein